MRGIYKMSTAELEALTERYSEADDEDLTDDDRERWHRAEQELDARELWDHEDERVRESVGNYSHE